MLRVHSVGLQRDLQLSVNLLPHPILTKTTLCVTKLAL